MSYGNNGRRGNQEYDERGKFSMWINDYAKGPNDPPWKGKFTDMEGNEYWIAMWERRPDASDRAPVFSGSISPKEEKRGRGNGQGYGRGQGYGGRQDQGYQGRPSGRGHRSEGLDY